MAPSTKALKEALVLGTCDVYKLDPDATTVNKVRHHVEQKLGLDPDFFTGEDWKRKSRDIIKEYVGKLLDGWEPRANANGVKPLNGASKKRSTAAKGNDKSAASSQDEGSAGSPVRDSSSPDRKRKRKADNESNEDENGSEDGNADSNKKQKLESQSPDPVADVNEEEEYSDVIDEPPASKRKNPKKEPGAKTTATSRSSETSKKKKKKSSGGGGGSAEPSDPLDAEVKKLQGQLTKCGVRKLWHNELKGCDGPRSKIRHLKDMLADIGMHGRFSEAKARQIKETRELQADAEAAQEMNRLWGMDSGGRQSRSKSRDAKIVQRGGRNDGDESDEVGGGDEDEDGDDKTGSAEENGHGDDDEDVSFAERKRKAHADLAFLDDESDSD